MENLRRKGVDNTIGREKVQVKLPSKRISEYYAENVFTDETMKKYISEEAYISIKDSINNKTKIDRNTADQVAAAMKSWAIEKGVKSYTHWFQPLTGGTAEKHDTFFVPTSTGKGMEMFTGNELVQQEPDASSFPNGGLRQTFEARGYTAWDPTSPAFIMEIGDGLTLCIPTIFISYTGESLDHKAPLLKASDFLEKAALPVIGLFDRHAKHVISTLGWEQEYFVIDESLYSARPDLVLGGRTLIGHSSAKGQQLDDHYFGSIPERVYDFMLDFEKEAHKLGIPVRTRHNEVAPGQFELAPMFEEVNIANDHNQLIMDVLKRVGKRHRLRVLFHEKPFKGINGSGKHNNWSMSTDTGKNLLSPGKTPKNNLRFLTFFVNVIKAVNDNSDLLRAAIASASNDHRLGANEAPPAIISVFIGSHLTGVLDEIAKRVKHGKYDEEKNADLKLDIHKQIPDVFLDNTDRNRTSPFAFTGNKFEVRAVGSTANCALPMTVLNTIVANQLVDFMQDYNELRKSGEKKEGAILRILRRYIDASKNILFEGDNYSEEWAKEAEKRGLSNVKQTAYAIDFFGTKAAKDIFVKNNIFTELELEARNEIYYEKYTLDIQIESRVLYEMASNEILPSAIEYQNRLIKNVKGLKELGLKKEAYKSQMDLLERMSGHINEVEQGCAAMLAERKVANKIEDASKRAKYYCDKVKPYFETIRYHIDKLELIVDDKLWPVPKYREMLFLK
ncbi:MAG: glutamine synthetase III [Chitinophagales bacterium]|nr:glutamine synthetase III [Chitinophagales bacterium]